MKKEEKNSISSCMIIWVSDIHSLPLFIFGLLTTTHFSERTQTLFEEENELQSNYFGHHRDCQSINPDYFDFSQK